MVSAMICVVGVPFHLGNIVPGDYGHRLSNGSYKFSNITVRPDRILMNEFMIGKFGVVNPSSVVTDPPPTIPGKGESHNTTTVFESSTVATMTREVSKFTTASVADTVASTVAITTESPSTVSERTEISVNITHNLSGAGNRVGKIDLFVVLFVVVANMWAKCLSAIIIDGQFPRKIQK